MEEMKRAIREYLDSNEKMLRELQSRGILQDMEIQSQMEEMRKQMEEYLEVNKPYAELLMGLQHFRYDRNIDYVSLTSFAKLKNIDNPSYVIQSWLRDKNTVEFLMLWEKDNNPDFKVDEAKTLVKRVVEPSFTLTAKVWISQTGAIGIKSKQGVNGGTFAHRDIAIDFVVWLFPEKRYELVKMISNRIIK